MATPIFICGAECGIVTSGAAGLTRHWDAASGAVTISTTTFRNGLRAYRFNPSAATTYLTKTVATTRLVGRIAFRFATLPTVDDVEVVRLIDTNGNFIFRYDTVAGKIEAIIGTGTAQVGPVIAINTWYVLDFDANSSGATATLDWKIDGVAQTQATRVQTSANITAFWISLYNVNNSADLFIDDIILSYTAADYPFGDGKVLGFSPNVDGTHSFTAGNFIYNAAGANILVTATDVNTYVDERPITNGGDFINQQTINAAGYVEIGFADTSETANARGLEVVCSQHSATTSANTAGMNLNDNGTIAAVYPNTSDISQTTLIFHSKQFATAPSTGLAWTQTRINALKLRWGYSTDADPDAYLDAVILEIEWAIAGAPVIVERSLSESLGSVSDATARALTRNIPISEAAISVADSPERATIKPQAVNEPSISVADSPVYNLQRGVAIGEPSIFISDAVALILRRIRDISESSISASDGVIAEKISPFSPRDVSEPPISAADAVSYILRRGVIVNEPAISITDSALAILIRLLSVSEPAISIVDAVSYILQRAIAVNEPAISITDSALAILIRLLSVSEPAISIADAVSYVLQRAIALNEPAISVADAASYLLQRAVAVNEPAISVTDSPLAALIRALSLSEPAISIGDVAAYILQRTIIVNEPAIIISDIVIPASIIGVSLSEPDITVADIISYLLERAVAISEPGITVSDLVEAGHLFSRGIAESIGAAGGVFPIFGGSHIIEIIGED